MRALRKQPFTGVTYQTLGPQHYISTGFPSAPTSAHDSQAQASFLKTPRTTSSSLPNPSHCFLTRRKTHCYFIYGETVCHYSTEFLSLLIGLKHILSTNQMSFYSRERIKCNLFNSQKELKIGMHLPKERKHIRILVV